MSARIPDHNGWYEIPANPLSKVGVFPYLGSSIRAPDPSKIYYVYRPAEELSNPETLASFRLVPWIDNHVMLGEGKPGYVPAEQKGVHGVTGENIWFNEADRTMYGNIKVFSSALQRTIDDGKVDLSLGYVSRYDPTPGVFEGVAYQYVQRSIRGNHMASVQDGRMGDDVSVMDSLTVTFDAKDIVTMARNPAWIKAKKLRLQTITQALKDKKKITPEQIATMDAAEETAGDPTLEDVADLLKDVLPQIADINAAMSDAQGSGDDDMEPEMDGAGNPVMDAAGKPVMKKKTVPAAKPATGTTAATDKKDVPAMDTATMDAAITKAVTAAIAPLVAEITTLKATGPKNMLTEISQRNKLAETLTHFVGTFDHADMTLQDVAVYGVKKLELPTTPGQEVASVTAYLHKRPLPTAGLATMDARAVVADKTKGLGKYISDSATAE